MADEFAAIARSLKLGLRLRAWKLVFNTRYRWSLQAVVCVAVHLIIHP